jgi:hypothetical protein
MNYYKIVVAPLDPITDAYIKALGGCEMGGGRYILDSDKDREHLKEMLAETAETVEVLEISESEFGSNRSNRVGRKPVAQISR